MTNISDKEKASETYLRFWQQFAKYLEDEGTTLPITTPRSQGNYDIKIDLKHGGIYYIVLAIRKTKKEKSVVIFVGNHEYSKDFFNLLKKEKEEIKEKFDIDVIFSKENFPETRRTGIEHKEKFYFGDEKNSDWDELNKWFKETAEKFDEFFTRRLNEIETDLKLKK